MGIAYPAYLANPSSGGMFRPDPSGHERRQSGTRPLRVLLTQPTWLIRLREECFDPALRVTNGVIARRQSGARPLRVLLTQPTWLIRLREECFDPALRVTNGVITRRQSGARPLWVLLTLAFLAYRNVKGTTPLIVAQVIGKLQHLFPSRETCSMFVWPLADPNAVKRNISWTR